MPRIRSASAHAKVIAAATELFAERGVEGTSMDAIAEGSGVSKATIYKHWADKEALLLEVMIEVIGVNQRPTLGSGDIRADMLAVLTNRPDENTELRRRLMPHFMAYAAHNQAFGDQWRHRVMEPPRRELRSLLKAGIKKGELKKMDLELATTLLLGPILYWHVLLRQKQDDPKPVANAAVEAFWRAFSK